jgi:hypothetical protein
MIDINLFEMLAAAEHDETDAEMIAFEKIPGPPIKGLKPETDVAAKPAQHPVSPSKDE